MLETFSFHPITSAWFDSIFSEASPPQKQGWPSIAANKNTLICAPTGSGKTLAAFLWCINDLLINKIAHPEKPNGIHTLYISPLKALNNDIERNLQQPLSGIAHHAKKNKITIPDITTLVRTGDTPANLRSKMLKTPPDVLITTPESLYLLLTNQKGRLLFGDLKYLIIDEIHALCPNKRGVHLSLSLERLMPLCKNEPVRIGLSATQKPLRRIAAYLGGLSGNLNQQNIINLKPRLVNIIDTGQRKNLDLKVISPVKNYSELPESSIWPEVYKLLYKLILKHKTTLIFAVMRSQTEKIARAINTLHQQGTDKKEVKIALAHHGSLSRETRYAIEEKLKNSQIPAVIATGSLELGIDIGSIDLVVQLESPKTVSAGLQRVGRSGHLIHATSKGRVIPLYQADLDDCAALTNAMFEGAIEETRIPENALDVLAQHIVAEVSMAEWDFETLFKLVKKSYCYRDLSPNAFQRVVEMLAGKIGNSTNSALYPRVNWDAINNKLIPKRGSQITAVMNGGTIPDRAYFAVYLNGENIKLGEMEEEFVFESRVGHIFYLGNTEYRIDDIRQDRIIVSLHNEVKPRAPFWKGDLLYRDYKTNLNIGHFRKQLAAHIKNNTAQQWLKKNFHTDKNISQNLIETTQRQLDHAGTIASDEQIILEDFIDEGDEPMLLVQAPFGARVNGLWALAISGILENLHNKQVQYTYDDDAFIIRLTNSAAMPDFLSILNISNNETENIILQKLIDSALFSVHFRYNAARALMLPRSQPGKRIPLWLQRLRAADLLQEVRKIPDFPIIAETYREVLYDVFDWPALKDVLGKIRNNEIQVHTLKSIKPSPMTAGLLFRMISDNMYEYDRSRQNSDGSINFTQLLADIIKRETIPQIVTAEINKDFSDKMQFLESGFQATDKEAVFSFIEKLGPISGKQLKLIASPNVTNWLYALEESNRIQKIEQPLAGWISVSHKNDYTSPWKLAGLENHLIRLFQNNGALTFTEILKAVNSDQDSIEQILKKLVKKEIIITGRLIKNNKSTFWCDRYNFARLYRITISTRRKSAKPASQTDLKAFLLNWHLRSENSININSLVETYHGSNLPFRFFCDSILATRTSNELQKDFTDQISSGKIIARLIQDDPQKQLREIIIKRSSGSNFWDKSDFSQDPLNEKEETICQFLKENGASFFNDIQDATGLSASMVSTTLGTLLKKGVLTSDNYNAIQSCAIARKSVQVKAVPQQISTFSGRQRRPGRLNSLQIIKERESLKSGRWFLLNTFPVMGKKRTRDEMAVFQAKMLLNRYGILVKEWYRHERGLMPWINIFNALKKLEWQGEINRGYFIKGLSGLQFGLPKALQLLNKIQSGQQEDINTLLSTIDPALPFGGSASWDLVDQDGNEIKVTRSKSNHCFISAGRFAAYLENNASRIFFTQNWQKNDLKLLVLSVKNMFNQKIKSGLKKVSICQINGKPAIKAAQTTVFLENGFETDGSNIVLWPSGL